MAQPYDNLTPYSVQNLKTVEGNYAAFSRLLARIKPKPKWVVEAMGGLGGQSREIKKTWPGVVHTAWERDSECCKELSKVPGVIVHVEDYPLTGLKLNKGTLLVLDFNLFTLKRFEELKLFFTNKAGWIILTDCARGKLHLHPEAYGLKKSADWADYVAALEGELNTVGLSIHSEEQAPRSITYFLLERVA